MDKGKQINELDGPTEEFFHSTTQKDRDQMYNKKS